HRNIERRCRMRQGTDGDILHPRFCDRADSVESDTAGSFGFVALVDQRNCTAQVVEREVVEHDAMESPTGECTLQLAERLHLDLDADPSFLPHPPHCCQRGFDAACCCDVVILDEHHVEEPLPVIVR